MKIEGRISIFINREYTTFEIEDENASVTFVKIRLTPEQLSAALSRQAMVECELEVHGIEKVGKRMEHESFVFEIPKELASSNNEDKLHEIAQGLLSDGWISDRYFRSQNTFFTKDDKQYARVTIRRWVPITATEVNERK